jgi:ATP-dependent helicase/DNAse subunit B
MPLTLVLGPANSAKAREVLGAYSLAVERAALLVVPTAADAAHYDRELAQTAHGRLALGRALTFPALIDEIAGRVGHAPARLTALQRRRLLRRTIAKLKLQTLGESARAPGFARAAGHLIAELEQARVAPGRFTAALRTWADGVPERLAYAADLSAIHRGYVQELGRLGIADAETFAWGALDMLREHPDRWPATPVFLYGFDDFTPVELDAIETLAVQAGANVTVSLTYEPGRPALLARASVVEELRQQAQRVIELPPLDDYYAPEARLALHHLERNLFEIEPPTVDPGESVQLLEAGGERAEGELVAAAVLAALDEGVPAQEIVVVCRSLARSGALLEGALRRYGVAVASARTLPLAHTALGRVVLATVRCALLEPDQASVMDLLKLVRAPGMSSEPAEVDQLEAALRRAGVTRLSDVTSRPQTRAAEPALRSIEALRGAAEPLTVLAELTRTLAVGPHLRSGAVFSGPEELDARAATEILGALTELSELDAAQAAPSSPQELIELLESIDVAAGPAPGPGDVLIAEPLAIRARRFRRVIVTGLCEGEFPSPQATSGDPFLGDDLRHELALASGLVLPVEGDPLARERYLLYSCASRATERLTFSYRSSDEEGNAVTPSVFLADIADLFVPEWRGRRRSRLLADVVWDPECAPTARERELAVAAHAAVAAPSPAGGRGPGLEPGLEQALQAEPEQALQAEPEQATRVLSGPATSVLTGPATRVLSDEALTHIRHTRVVSAGALEMFAACPVRWLIERQLGAEDLEGVPEPLARGSLMHEVLERVFSELGGPLSAAALPEAERLLSAAMAQTPNTVGHGQPREIREAMLRGIEADLRRYLAHEAADGSGWIPTRLELRFGTGDDALAAVAIGEGEEQVMLSGVVDRVDVEPGGDRAIVRDYKSGAKQDSWPAARWLSDDQLQVGLYMLAVRRLEGLRTVAGFYQPLRGEDLRQRGVFTAQARTGDNVLQTDEMGVDELDQLLSEVEREAARIAAQLRSGELTPCPERCSPNGGCSHPGICWAPA